MEETEEKFLKTIFSKFNADYNHTSYHDRQLLKKYINKNLSKEINECMEYSIFSRFGWLYTVNTLLNKFDFYDNFKDEYFNREFSGELKSFLSVIGGIIESNDNSVLIQKLKSLEFKLEPISEFIERLEENKDL